MEELSIQRVYVDTEHALVLYRQTPRGSADTDIAWMALDTVADAGLTHRQMLMSTSGDGEVPLGSCFADAERLAHAHRDLWTSTDPDAEPDGEPGSEVADVVAAMYAPGATVADTVCGVEHVGRGAIAEQVAQSSERWRPAASGVDDVPAVFVHQLSPYANALTRVVYLVTGADGGHLAVDLALDASGVVTHEQRYHDAAALPSAMVTDVATGQPDAWWVGLSPPPRPADLPPVLLSSDHGPVDVHGADKATMDRLSWALGRFTAAGLAQPHVDTVVVDTYGLACVHASGVAVVSDDRTVLTVCPDAAALCEDEECATPRPYPSQSILHELAHAWTATYLTEPDRRSFMASAGLTAWADRSVPGASAGRRLPPRPSRGGSWTPRSPCTVSATPDLLGSQDGSS